MSIVRHPAIGGPAGGSLNSSKRKSILRRRLTIRQRHWEFRLSLNGEGRIYFGLLSSVEGGLPQSSMLVLKSTSTTKGIRVNNNKKMKKKWKLGKNERSDHLPGIN